MKPLHLQLRLPSGEQPQHLLVLEVSTGRDASPGVGRRGLAEAAGQEDP